MLCLKGNSMGRYLRDQMICNIELDLEAIDSICEIVRDRAEEWNSSLTNEQRDGKEISVCYLIRFDGKGFIVFELEELKKYYEQATNVERIVINAYNVVLQRQSPAFLELSLDARNDAACSITASSDDRDWMEASFSNLNEALQKYRTNNGLVRTGWTPFVVQIFGVFIGFLCAIWAASEVYKFIKFESPFAVALLFFILLFSNVWTYVYPRLLSFIFYVFPNVAFIQRKRASVHWFYQTIIGTSVFAIVVFCLTKIWSAVSKYVAGFVV